MIIVNIPDSHGMYIDHGAKDALLNDLKFLRPKRGVLLGDHVDVSGVFSNHPTNYLEELEYSYTEDIKAANTFLDEVQKYVGELDYLEGNHEQHVERWAVQTFTKKEDAAGVLKAYAPRNKLSLKKRGIRYHQMSECHMGLAVPGTIRIGKCLYTHGSKAGKHATAAHLDDYGTNIVHGHTHRAQGIVRRTAEAGAIGGWCPGTLAKLQPLYLHTQVSAWTHGYGLQFMNGKGEFQHINVPIVNGVSMLKPMLDELQLKGRHK